MSQSSCFENQMPGAYMKRRAFVTESVVIPAEIQELFHAAADIAAPAQDQARTGGDLGLQRDPGHLRH